MNDLEHRILTINNLIDIPRLNNAAAVGMMFIELIQELKTNLSTIEAVFRQLNSRVHLVGLPLKFYGTDYVARIPNQNKSLDYGLWIGLNGLEEINQMLEQHNIAFDDTDISLSNTGFLTLK